MNNEFKFSENFNPGAYRDRFDSRDYQWAPLALAMGIEESFDWDKGFDTEEVLGIKIKIENQGTQSSCTSQSLSSYGDLLNYRETGKWEDFGAKGIYAQIALPQGGGYMRDALDVVVNQGFYLESDLPSYDRSGNPLTEMDVRRSEDITTDMRNKAVQWKSLRYYALPANDIDSWAIAIKNNWAIYMGATGSNNGWKQADLIPPAPDDNKWGHAVFGKAAKLRNGKKTIKIQNSWGERWGENGNGWLNEDYVNSNNVFAPWVLIDQRNINIKTMISTIKTQNDPNIYAKSNTTNKIYPFGAWQSYQEMLSAGWIEPFREVDSLNDYVIVDGPMGFLK